MARDKLYRNVDIAPLFRLGGRFRDLFVYEIKAPIKVVLNLIDHRLPTPTKENTIQPNTWVWIDIRDEFLDRCKTQTKIYHALWNFAITLYEFDEPYRQFGDWVVSKILARQGDWKPLEKNKPDILVWKQDWEIGGD